MFDRFPDVDQLERLTSDLRDYAAGKLPDERALAAAPVLTNWRVGYRSNFALHGTTTNHPVLLGRRNITTSTLFYISPDLQWARTASRLYRLGVSFADLRH